MCRVLAATIVALLSVPALAQSVWVAPSTQKVRPGDSPNGAGPVTLEAAGNEFEAFHVVINGGSNGAASVTVAGDELSGPDGAVINDVRVYREGWYDVTTISSVQGATGRWPDAMIPAIDEIDGQQRLAFPWSVPANEQQPIFVEYHVPENAPAGWYSGTVHVTGGVVADVPVKLYVHAFNLPSTSSLPSAYSLGWADPCIAHYGSYTLCGGDAGVEILLNKYTRLALDHRITISDAVYDGPSKTSTGAYDWATWDATYGPLLDGTVGGRLTGAKLTTIHYQWVVDQAHYAEWAQHFRVHGWFNRTFDYTCDEPPAGCDWASINTRAAMVHAADPQFRTLVTTSISLAQQNGVLSSVDILVPIIQWLDPEPPGTNTRASYDGWLGQTPQHELWTYQSCMSDGCNTVGDASFSGWPSLVIDTSATRNRAMQWQDWRQRVSGELYYDTTYAYSGNAWTNQFYFGNNGDGTLFYPGTPAMIGGTSQVPIASFRMKMIREGMEDYEYFKLLADSGDPTMADAEAAGLSPSAWQNQGTTAADIDGARHRIALRIEALTGQTPPPMGNGTDTGAPGTDGGVTDGGVTDGGVTDGMTGANGGASGGSGGGTTVGGVGGGVSNNPGASAGSPAGNPSAGTSGCSYAPGRQSNRNPRTIAFLALLLASLAWGRARRPTG
jgi:hypothetical protein